MSASAKCSPQAANLLKKLAHTGDGVFAVNPHQQIVLWNQAAESLLGYSAQQALGKNCHDVIQGRDSNGILVCGKQCSHCEAAKSLRRLPNENLCARSKNGADVWINITTLSVLSRPGKLSALVHFFRKAAENTDHPGQEKELARPEAKSVSGSAPQVESPRPKEKRNPAVPLTRREHTILCHLAEGMSTKAIGQRLYISPTTVKNHVQSILKKLQVHSRVEAVALAFHRGLV